MKIEDYLQYGQEINAATDPEKHCLKHVQMIEIFGNGRCMPFVKIFVGRISENGWSFGWECYNTMYKLEIMKECLSTSIMYGNINTLLYGVLKRLYMYFENKKHWSYRDVQVAIMQAICTVEKHIGK